MAKMQIMDHSGHTTLEFTKEDKASLVKAEARFKELTGVGFTAARMKDGHGEVIRKFEQVGDADEVLMIPRYQGG